MFCTNCGKTIPDNSVNCPNCGVATGAVPAAPQAAAPAPQAAPMGAPAPNVYAPPAAAYGPRKSFNFKMLYDVSVNRFIPIILIGILIALMVGAHSLDIVNWKYKGTSMDRQKAGYDACLEGLDTGFNSFMKFFGLLTEIGALGGIIVALLYLNKDNLKAIKFLGISVISMCVMYMFLLFYGLHVMGEVKDGMKDAKTKGGVTVSIILLMIFTMGLVVYWLFASKIIKVGNKPKFNGGYGMPQQNFGASQNFGAPQQGFGAPQQGFGAPQQGFGAPQNPAAPQNPNAPQNFNNTQNPGQ